MVTEHDIRQALDAAADLPYGPERAVVTENAVGLADELGSPWWQVEARVQLASAYTYGDCGPHEFTVQAWLLAALDRADPPLDAQHRHTVLWQCKWAMERALETSTIPLDVMRRTFDDVERRYRAEGESDQPAAKYQLLLARDTADEATVGAWATRWRTSPRSGMSDCDACDALDDAKIRADDGDPVGALRRVMPTLEGRATCLEEPQASLSWAVDWYARQGLFSEAERAHLQGWRLVQRRADDAELAVRHLVFLVRAGRVDRAVSLLLPRLGWVRQTRLDRSRMDLAAAGAMVLRAGLAEGHVPDTLDGEPTARVLARLEETAASLAAAFDARNGTDRVSRRLAARVDPTPYDLAAAPDDFLLAVTGVAVAAGPPAAAPSGPATPAPSGPAADGGAPTPADGGGPLPADIAAYGSAVARAVDAMQGPEVNRLLAGWLAARSHLRAVTPQEHATVARLERLALQDDDVTPEEAGTLLGSALEHAEASGDRATLLRVRVESELRQLRAGDVAARDRAGELVTDLETTGDWTQVGSAWLSLSRTGDPAADLDAALRAVDAFGRAGAAEAGWRAASLQSAGYAAVFVDPERAPGLLEEARSIAAAEGLLDLELACLDTLARFAWQSRDIETGTRHLRAAIDLASRHGHASGLGFHTTLADVLVDAGDWPGLLEAGRAELRTAVRSGDRVAVARAQRHVGLALQETGHSAEAAEVLETARPVLAAAQDPAHAVACWALGNALAALGDHGPAAAAFSDAATAFLADDRPDEAAHALHRQGDELTASGGPGDAVAAVAVLDAAADRSRESGNARLHAAVLQSRADAVALADGPDAAVRDLDTLADRVGAALTEGDTSVDLEHLRAMALRQGALLLADRGRPEEALPRLEASARVLESAGDDAALVVRSERARIQLGQGHSPEGEQTLRELLPELERAGYRDAVGRAASSLCTYLARTDRDAEADALWARWGESPGA